MPTTTPANNSAPSSLEERQRWLDEERNRPAGRRRPLVPTSSVATSHGPGWEQRHWSSRLLHRVGDITSRSGAGIIAFGIVVGWMVLGIATGFPSWWEADLYSATASVTFVMVFVIQHTNERQTSATQRKLDELIRSSAEADDALIAVEEAPDEHLQALGQLNLVDREGAQAVVDS